MSKLYLGGNGGVFIEPEDSIKLETSKGTRIPNNQLHTIFKSEIALNSKIEADYKAMPAIIFKGNPTAIYNCHGLTFGSRRTMIDPSNVRMILKEDSYIQINSSDVLAGDIVLYISNDGKGDIQHTGIIIQIDTGCTPNCIWILSKWGRYKEVIHPLTYSIYNDCNYEYWRNNHGYTEE